MGTGIWSMHFVGMQAASFPFAVGFGYAMTALSWVAAVAASAVALSIASRSHLPKRRWIQGSLAMGTGICTMHYIGMAAMNMEPGIHWSTGWVTASAVIAVIASAGALQIFFGLRQLKGRAARRGHACGDAVLREMTHRLLSQVRATDTVARVGGDEFVMLVEDNPDAAAVVMIAQRVIELLARQVIWQDSEVRLSGSVGIAMYPADSTRESLMTNADAAMYAVKRAGGSDFAFFAPRMNAGARGQIELRNDLRLAIEQGELQLHYQPKVCACDGTFKGVEGLARWRHATRGVVGPDVFIPIAERFGLIGALGQWVIEEACGQIARWREDGLEVRVAINLSVHQLRQADLASRLLPARMNVNFIEVMPVTQSFGPLAIHRQAV